MVHVPGVGDIVDDCPSAPNSTQLDSDHDGDGNACELNDGINIMSFAGSGIDWQAEIATSYNLYRSSRARLIATGEYAQDPIVEPEATRFCGQLGTHVNDTHNPESGQVNFYLVNNVLGGAVLRIVNELAAKVGVPSWAPESARPPHQRAETVHNVVDRGFFRGERCSRRSERPSAAKTASQDRPGDAIAAPAGHWDPRNRRKRDESPKVAPSLVVPDGLEAAVPS